MISRQRSCPNSEREAMIKIIINLRPNSDVSLAIGSRSNRIRGGGTLPVLRLHLLEPRINLLILKYSQKLKAHQRQIVAVVYDNVTISFSIIFYNNFIKFLL